MVDKRALIDAPERRAIAVSEFELRADGPNSLAFTGYASVFNKQYQVRGGPPQGWNEQVSPRAFDVTLAQNPDLHLLINHEGMPLARTRSGTMKLATDSIGLHVNASLDRRDPDVQRLEVKMERKDMDEMSFAFRTKRDTWDESETHRTLEEVSIHKGDVSIVNFGANPHTSAELNMRAVVDYLTRVSPEQAVTELRALGDDADARMRRASESLSALRRCLSPKPGDRPLSMAEARAVIEYGLDFRMDMGNVATAPTGGLDAAARRYCASRGWAMPDGAYPIRPANMHGATDLSAAIRAVGRGNASHDAIRAHIMKRASAIGMSDQIPDNWKASGSN